MVALRCNRYRRDGRWTKELGQVPARPGSASGHGAGLWYALEAKLGYDPALVCPPPMSSRATPERRPIGTREPRVRGRRHEGTDRAAPADHDRHARPHRG